MFSQACNEAIEQIRRHFGYLFEEYGFAPVYCKDVSHGEHILIVLQSPDCRIKFIYDRGAVEVTIGTLSSPIDWADSLNGTRHWFYLWRIVAFVEKRPRMTDAERKQLANAVQLMTTDEFLEHISRDLQSHINQVVALFREDVFEKKRDEVQEFRDSY